MQMGTSRISEIVKSLRTFSRLDESQLKAVNIHEGIDSTLLILRHRLKTNQHRPEIEVITNYGKLPKIECFPGQLNQVFMNIIANAIDALDESNAGRSFAAIQAHPHRITITTHRRGLCAGSLEQAHGASEPRTAWAAAHRGPRLLHPHERHTQPASHARQCLDQPGQCRGRVLRPCRGLGAQLQSV